MSTPSLDESAGAIHPAGNGSEDAPPIDAIGLPDTSRRSGVPVSTTGVIAIGLLALSMAAYAGFSISKSFATPKQSDIANNVGERPAAAGGDIHRPDLSVRPAPASAPTIPAILPLPEDKAKPIPLREAPRASPEDAPVLVLSSRGEQTATPQASRSDDALDGTRKNLEAYQRQLRGVLDSIGNPATRPPAGTAPKEEPAGLFGGELQRSSTPRVRAGTLGDRSLVMPKGTSFTCALLDRIVSANSGMLSCQVQRNVYGDDGRVVLIERGSHLEGEYRGTALRPGSIRIPILWTRVRTPFGVTVELDSPATGRLGEAGVDGQVDNRWTERIGAAMLLSLIDDGLRVATQPSNQGGNTVVLQNTTSNAETLAGKVLDSTVNLPPVIYQDHSAIVGVKVARDVDFSTVYELRTSAR